MSVLVPERLASYLKHFLVIIVCGVHSSSEILWQIQTVNTFLLIKNLTSDNVIC